MAIIEKVRSINNDAYILARTPFIQQIEELYKVGADEVLPEKLEIAIDLLNRILVKRSTSQKEISRIISHVRYDNLGKFTEKDSINKPTVLDEFSDKITMIKVGSSTFAEGKSPLEIQLRKKTGVTLLAIKRGKILFEHPSPEIIFHKDDIAYVLGSKDQVDLANDMLMNKVTL